MQTLLDLPVDELAGKIRRAEIRCTELTEAYLQRIKRIDREVNAYLNIDRQGALRQAEAIDSAVVGGRDPGPLAGVPLAIKDIFITRDQPTTCGSRILKGWQPLDDATVVIRLRSAGAVVLGKTNMDEFAMGSSNEQSAFGACRNPHALDHVAGGSSGGSAAAVAAELAAVALGTDTGGSIRQPASFCGVVGIKPTYGRVSRRGLVAFASSLDQAGPLARRVCDCASVLEVIAGHDPSDSTSVDRSVGRYRAACDRPINGLRVGVPREYFGEGIDEEVRRAVRDAIETLAGLGAEVKEISLPHTSYAVAAYYLICTAEASSNLARFDGVRFGHRAQSADSLAEMYGRTRQEGFGEEVQRRILLGTFALSAGYHDAYYGKAQRVRTLIRRDFDDAWRQCDVIVTPTCPAPAFRLGERVDDPLQMYLADIFTISCNLAGLPGLSLPCGVAHREDRSLPLGLQIIGPPFAEERVFSVAAAYEGCHSWREQLRSSMTAATAEVGP